MCALCSCVAAVIKIDKNILNITNHNNNTPNKVEEEKNRRKKNTLIFRIKISCIQAVINTHCIQRKNNKSVERLK